MYYVCIYVRMYVYICMCMYVCVCVCMYVCVYVCMCVCMYVCMCVCMYVCVCMYAVTGTAAKVYKFSFMKQPFIALSVLRQIPSLFPNRVLRGARSSASMICFNSLCLLQKHAQYNPLRRVFSERKKAIFFCNVK